MKDSRITLVLANTGCLVAQVMLACLLLHIPAHAAFFVFAVCAWSLYLKPNFEFRFYLLPVTGKFLA